MTTVMKMTGRMDDERRRPLWCSAVDRAMQLAIASGKPFDIERLLDSIGIFAWSPFRRRAAVYAETLIAARNGGSQ